MDKSTIRDVLSSKPLQGIAAVIAILSAVAAFVDPPENNQQNNLNQTINNSNNIIQTFGDNSGINTH